MESKDISTRMYFEAFQPFSVTTGTRYPATSQGTIDFHRAAFFRRRNNGTLISPTTATKEILQHNCDETRILSVAEIAAINRLAKVIHDIRKNKAPYSPDLSIKAFPDLDLIFFNGRLGRNVCVNWSSDESDARLRDTLRPWGTIWGVTREEQHISERNQCRILFNAETIFSELTTRPLERMMATTLKEMCRAFDIVRCGPIRESRDDEHFETRIRAVHERAMWTVGLGAICEDERF